LIPAESALAALSEADRQAAAAGNRMRWEPGQRGRYEGWYVAFNDPQQGLGFWIRYSLRASSDAAEAPYCQLWFMRTDASASKRNRALRQTFAIDRLEPSTEPFRIRAGDGSLDASGCRGTLRDAGGEVSWELTFEPLLPPITPTPEWGARVATCYQEPHPLLRISGTIEEGSRTHGISGLLGEQAHVFGARHSQKWHWAECKHLGGKGVAFVGVAAWPRMPGGERPVTSIYLDLGDSRSYLHNSTLEMLRPKTKHSPDGWHFDATYRRDRIVGSVMPRREDLIGVTYRDPSGEPVYCYHSELADFKLELYQKDRGKWRQEEEISSPHSAAFEYGSATPLPEVPLLLD